MGGYKNIQDKIQIKYNLYIFYKNPSISKYPSEYIFFLCKNDFIIFVNHQ